MTHLTRGTRRMAAPLAEILDVVLDLEAYPTWSADVRRAEVIARGADGRPSRGLLELAAGPVRDELLFDYTVTQAPRRAAMGWQLVTAGQVRDLRGRYALAELGPGTTEVTYELDVDPGFALHSALKEKMQARIVEAALEGLERHVTA